MVGKVQQVTGALESLRTFTRDLREQQLTKLETTDPQLAAQMRAADERTSEEILDSSGHGNELKRTVKQFLKK